MDILNFISWVKGGRQVTAVDPARTLLPVGLKDGRRDDSYLAGAISVADFASQIGGLQTVAVDGTTITGDGTPGDPLIATARSLGGTSYAVVYGNGTAEENGIELQAAYDAAKLATPYGNPLDVSNRFTILVGGGDYFMEGTPVYASPGIVYNQLILDTNYIDIVSLSGECDVFLSGISLEGFISFKVSGLNTTKALSLGGFSDAFIIYTDEGDGLICQNCKGGNFSFNNFAGFGLYGTFINCNGGEYSFGAVTFAFPMGLPFYVNADSYGTFTGCVAGNNSFVFNDFMSSKAGGVYTDCKAGHMSFANNGFSITSGCFVAGTMENCKALSLSFGNTIFPSAVLRNCIADSNSFGGYKFSGAAYNCISTGNSSFGNDKVIGKSYVQEDARISYCTMLADEFINPTPLTNVIFACADITGLKTY